MVKPFEDAVFAMKEGDISEVVESDFGFHIIQLTGIKAPKTPSFEAMRPQLEADLRKQQAQRKFAELADTFTNGVYEQSDSLKPVAEKLKLSVQQAKGVTRVPGAVPVLANPKLLQALFSDDAVSKRRNTEAVEVAPNTLVSARITNYHAAAVRPYDEVKDEVKRQFIADQSAELARTEGQAKLAAWKDQPAQAQVGAALVVSRDQPQNQPPALLDAALRADPAKLPAITGVDLGAQGYAVARVNKIVPREAQDPQKTEQARQQFAQLWGQAEAQAYMAALKAQFKAEILVPAGGSKTANADGK
jgi:peptidyl-prolyl cis-trans isomerase D